MRESAEKKRSKRSKTQKKNLRSKKYTIFIRSPQGRVRALFCVLNGKKASFGLYYYYFFFALFLLFLKNLETSFAFARSKC